MKLEWRLWLWLCLMTGMLATGCVLDRSKHPDACITNRDCPSGRTCYAKLCIAAGGATTSLQGAPCVNGTAPVSCYEGNLTTRDRGTCRGGQRFCVSGKLSACLEQVLPISESCNMQDDDCNGTIDDIADEACNVETGAVCKKAGKRVCRAGVSLCELAPSSLDEVCNGSDDDCDGNVDEVVKKPCFPQGQTGCAPDTTGTLQCQGVCVAGELDCQQGVGACTGAVVAGIETCEAANGVAYDDDCDGKIDEGCACTGSASRDCHAGPKGTEGTGACTLGTQSCSADRWTPCQGQGAPLAEACDNQNKDDDCNGVKDDIANLGASCVDFAKLGECRSGTSQCVPGFAVAVCVGQMPTTELCDFLDQNCDGDPQDGFDLNSDDRCGSCTKQCTGGDSCCSGKCMSDADFEQDDDNCGSCGNGCGTGYCCQGQCLSSNSADGTAACDCSQDCGNDACCGTSCVKLSTDKNNCGACGIKCMKMCKSGVCE